MYQIVFYTTERDDSPIDEIRELRIHYSANQYRILYFFQAGDQIVLSHAFAKKTQQLKEKDIELAERRMQDWLHRYPSGGNHEKIKGAYFQKPSA